MRPEKCSRVSTFRPGKTWKWSTLRPRQKRAIHLLWHTLCWFPAAWWLTTPQTCNTLKIWMKLTNWTNEWMWMTEWMNEWMCISVYCRKSWSVIFIFVKDQKSPCTANAGSSFGSLTAINFGLTKIWRTKSSAGYVPSSLLMHENMCVNVQWITFVHL